MSVTPDPECPKNPNMTYMKPHEYVFATEDYAVAGKDYFLFFCKWCLHLETRSVPL